MISPGLVYLLLSAVLFTVAAVTHFHASSLLLPIPPALTILAAVLPLIGFINAYIRPNLLLTARSTNSRLHQLLPTALQTAQAILATVLITLLVQNVIGSPALQCILQDVWQRFYRTHDAQSVRRIQDAFDCCGFNSVRDRAYPWGDREPSRCAETYGREESCRAPWTRAMQGTSGVDLGVVLAAGILQIIGLLMMREGASWWTAWRIFSRDSRGEREPSYRPLLPAQEVDDEETAETVDGSHRDYGTQASGAPQGPRVEPSPMHERNAWED